MTPAAVLAKALRECNLKCSRDRIVALAKEQGITPAIAGRAFAGRPVNAADHLLLCAVFYIDPYGTDFHRWPAPECRFDHTVMGMGLRMRRFLSGDSNAEVAWATGVSTATISRIEHGEPVSIASVLTVCKYIKVHPLDYFAPLKPGPLTVRVPRETSPASRSAA